MSNSCSLFYASQYTTQDGFNGPRSSSHGPWGEAALAGGRRRYTGGVHVCHCLLPHLLHSQAGGGGRDHGEFGRLQSRLFVLQFTATPHCLDPLPPPPSNPATYTHTYKVLHTSIDRLEHKPGSNTAVMFLKDFRKFSLEFPTPEECQDMIDALEVLSQPGE